jgi:hypothetical protein
VILTPVAGSIVTARVVWRVATTYTDPVTISVKQTRRDRAPAFPDVVVAARRGDEVRRGDEAAAQLGVHSSFRSEPWRGHLVRMVLNLAVSVAAVQALHAQLNVFS